MTRSPAPEFAQPSTPVLAPTAPVRVAGLRPRETVTALEAAINDGVEVQLAASCFPVVAAALGFAANEDVWIPLGSSSPGRFVSSLLRSRDVVCSLAAGVVVAPLVGLLALVVVLTSGRPALYRAEVVGQDGRRFTWTKLRTMRPTDSDADQERRRQFQEFVRNSERASGSGKIVNRSRITPFGSFLRRHSLDELPQLWNVLTGDMTLVGPRPCLPYEFDLQAPWQRLRFRTQPGLTGPWQAYARSAVSFDEMALLDYCYVHRKGFWLDVRILVRTVLVVISGSGGQ